jgi:hypothetical protein
LPRFPHGTMSIAKVISLLFSFSPVVDPCKTVKPLYVLPKASMSYAVAWHREVTPLLLSLQVAR